MLPLANLPEAALEKRAPVSSETTTVDAARLPLAWCIRFQSTSVVLTGYSYAESFLLQHHTKNVA